MPGLIYNYGFWEFWAPYDPSNQFFGYQKAIFDGENRIIRIDPTVSELNVKEDIYSAWKEWIQVRDNAKFLPAIRTTGGDPIGEGDFTGDIYFLINEWTILLERSLVINGVLFSDDFPSPYVQADGTSLVTNRISNLVQTVSPDISLANISSETAEAVWNYPLRELSSTMTPEQFWNFLLSQPVQPGSAGERLRQVLTTSNFLALK